MTGKFADVRWSNGTVPRSNMMDYQTSDVGYHRPSVRLESTCVMIRRYIVHDAIQHAVQLSLLGTRLNVKYSLQRSRFCPMVVMVKFPCGGISPLEALSSYMCQPSCALSYELFTIYLEFSRRCSRCYSCTKLY